MTRLIRFANNASSRLAANITNSSTSISITPGDGSKFPSPSGGQYFMATLVKSDGTTEVVKVTARATDTLTVVRAAEAVGGVTTAYAFSAGDKLEGRLTAGGLGGELDRLDTPATLNKTAAYSVTQADKSALVRVDTTSAAVTVTLPQISTLTDEFDIVIAKVTSDVNAVTVARSSTDTINGNTVYNLTAQWQSVWFIADRSTNTWTAVQSSSAIGVNAIVDEGTGTGASTVTLSVDPGSKNNVIFVVGGVVQSPSTFSISGTTLTAGGVIASGVKWYAKYDVPLSIGTPADLSVTTAKLAASAVTAAKMASGAAAGNLGLSLWNITESAGVLYFSYSGVNKFKIDSTGKITVANDVVGFGTV